jgi:hypothetical protein
MRVCRRRGDALVAEKYLYDAGVHLLFQEPGGVRVPQQMRRRAANTTQIGELDGVGKGANQHAGADRTGPRVVGKQPALIAVLAPQEAQACVDRLRQRDQTFLVALADNPHHAVGDGGHFEVGGFRNAQAAGVDQAKAGAVDRIADIGQDAPDLDVGQRLGKPLLLRQPDLFLKRDQSRPSV